MRSTFRLGAELAVKNAVRGVKVLSMFMREREELKEVQERFCNVRYVSFIEIPASYFQSTKKGIESQSKTNSSTKP